MAYLGIPARTHGSNLTSAVITLDTNGRVRRASNVNIAIPAIASISVSLPNTDYYICLANSTTGLLSPNVFISNTQLYFNPFSATLTCVNFNSVSDVSLKENIISIDNPSSIVDNLSGVEFTWKDNKQKSSGFIAQEVEQFLPHLVDKNKNGIKTVNYQGIIAYLVETIKELNGRLKDVEQKLGK